MTARKRAERALEQSENRFRALVEATSDCIWECDADGRFTYLSPNFEKIVGEPAETFLGRTPADLPVVDGMASEPPPHLPSLTEQAPARNLEYTLRHRNGRLVECEVNAVPVFAPSGEFTGMRGVTRDVTQRNEARRARAAAEAAREAAERLGALADGGIAGVNQVDRSGRYVYVSDRFCEIVGRSREELLRMSVLDLTHPDDRITSADKLREVVASGKGFTTEKRYVRGDGSAVCVLNAVAINRTADGNPIGYVALVLDITERKLQAKALENAERRWKFALEGAGQGVWDWDVEQGTVYYSPIYAQMLGYAQAELGNSAEVGFSRIHPDDLPALQAAVESHCRGDAPLYNAEFRIRHKDGHYLCVESRGMIVERLPDGRPKRMIGSHVDITERKRNEEALRASEARTAFLIRLTDALRGLTNPDAVRFEAARLLAEHIGADRVGYAEDGGDGVHVDITRNYTRGVPSLEGRYRYDDYGPALLREFRAGRTVVRPDIANDPALTAEEKAAHATLGLGATINVPLLKEGRLTAILFAHCTTARQWAAEDIALCEEVARRIWADVLRLRSEQALARKTEQLQLAIEGADIGTWYFSIPAGVREWSDRCKVLLALPPLQAPSAKHFYSVVHPDDRDRVKGLVGEAMENHGAYATEYRIVHPDGSVHWASALGQAYFNADGSPRGMGGIMLDITERKRGEAALQALTENLERQVAERTAALAQSEANLQRAQAIAKIGSWWLCGDTEHFGMSKETARIFELEDTGATTFSEWFARIHPDDQSSVEQKWRAALAGAPYENTYRLLIGGRVTWIRAQAELQFDADRKLLRAIGTVQDITDRKAAEQDLIDARAVAEAAGTAKAEFLAHMSHEIRTPMNAVINFAQLLQEEPLTPDQSELVGTINEAGQALLRIINDILDFSKIEAGQLAIEQRPFELANLINRVDSLLRPAAEAKGLRFSIRAPATLSRAIRGDALRMEQVLVNLINNAIKFTRQGDITATVTTQEETADGVRLRFEVRDTGIGIAPDALKLLFQPFSQANRGITRRFGGTGLGLVISKQIVEMMGGEIGVTSDLGHGSNFWFEVPFAWAEATAGAPAPSNDAEATGPRLAGLRVLAADDNHVNLLIVDKILKSQGATTVFAADGQQALQILQANPQGFDVVLMDVQMPIMDGLTATRAIRANPALAHLPVIALTAGVLEKERDRAVAVGVNDFLPKPIDPKQMIGMLAAIRASGTRGR